LNHINILQFFDILSNIGKRALNDLHTILFCTLIYGRTLREQRGMDINYNRTYIFCDTEYNLPSLTVICWSWLIGWWFLN